MIKEKDVAMKRIIYWLKKRKRIEKKYCGQCGLTCKYYAECIRDGAL